MTNKTKLLASTAGPAAEEAAEIACGANVDPARKATGLPTEDNSSPPAARGPPATAPHGDVLLRQAAVLVKLGNCSAMQLWRYRRHAGFPAPLYLTDGGAPLWRESEVDRWIAERAAAGNRPKRIKEAETADAA